MSNANTPSAELLAELEVLRSRVRELENAENERRRTEEALQESEERVRRMVESLPIVLYSAEAGTNQVFLLAGPVREIFGYGPEQFRADPELGARMIHPDDATRVAEIFREGLASLKPFELELRMIHGIDGRTVWLHQRVVPVVGEDGSLLRQHSVLTDITERKQAEEALRESENLLRTIINATKEAMISIGQDGLVTLFNPAAEKMFGRKREEMVGKPLDCLMPEAYRELHREHVRSYFATGEPQGAIGKTCELPGSRSDGETFPMAISLSPGRHGNKQFVIAVVRDITERKRAEEALRESEERFQQVVTNAQAWVWEVDAEGVYTYASPVVERILGYKPEEIVGRKHFYDLFHPDEREGLRKTALEVFSQQQPFHEFVNRNLHKNGKTVWLSTSGVPILDERGNLLGYRGADSDITERKRAEEALRESEELYRSLVETSPDGIILTDLDGNIVMVNQRAAELHGIERMEDMLGRDGLEFIAAEDRQRAREDVQTALRAGSLRDKEYTLLRQDGSSFRGEFSGSVIVDAEGRPKGLIAVVRDVTERNRLQQQLLQSQKLESVGTLAGGIAHDFNNLLAVIVGNISMLQRQDDLPAKVRDLLGDIMGAAERGSALTHQLLAYARGGLHRPAPTDLNRVIESMLHMLNRTTLPSIEFVLSLPKDLPPIMADATQIEQVVMNLCLNAIQASPPAGTIEVFAEEQMLSADQAADFELAEGRYICLRVKDRGCGMDAETVERVFEPFFTTKPMGRGMGLAATHGIVHSHHGQIRVESTPGGGTTMSVWLPIVREEAAAPVLPPAPKPMEPPHGSETVLVIDNDPGVTRTVEQLLSSLGYCPVSRMDSDEAIVFLGANSEDVDLVLLNLHMPKRFAGEMLAEIRRRCPHVPIVLASGLHARGLVKTLMAQGAAGFVQKPFSLMTLATAIRNALDDAARPAQRRGH